MQKEEYLIKNACYSVTKYYLCKHNNKRSLLGRKQRSQVARSFPNRYLFSYTNNVTSLFSIRYILIVILRCNLPHFVVYSASSYCLICLKSQLIMNGIACKRNENETVEVLK